MGLPFCVSWQEFPFPQPSMLHLHSSAACAIARVDRNVWRAGCRLPQPQGRFQAPDSLQQGVHRGQL